METFTQFGAQPNAPSANTSLATLLHRADQLSTAFNSHHGQSFQNVQSVASSYNQLQNLLALPDTRVTRAQPSMKERGMVKVRFAFPPRRSTILLSSSALRR